MSVQGEPGAIDPQTVPIFILCGGLGTRLSEETGLKPKAMVLIGGEPIVLHVMRWYRRHGFRRFVLCTGFKSEIIKDFFLNYTALRSDFTTDFSSNRTVFHRVEHTLDWEVTVAYTGEHTMTGARVKRAAAHYLGPSAHFGVTYCDGLTDADLGVEYAFHVAHGGVGTVLGVVPVSRFGEFQMDGTLAAGFVEKPEFDGKFINGGYFFFRREFLAYLEEEDPCILERAPLARLAQDRQLHVYKNTGFWACMDTLRDSIHLNGRWNSGDAPWRV